MRDAAAVVFVILAIAICVAVGLAKLLGVSAADVRGACRDHRGVAQISTYVPRKVSHIVVCRDGYATGVRP